MFDPNKPRPEQAVWQLLQKAQLSEQEISTRLQQAQSIDYWQNLNPNLTIESTIQPKSIQSGHLESQAYHKLCDRFVKQGYFQIDSSLSELVIQNMKTCICTLRQAGWPAVFGYLYDQFWLIWQIPQLVDFLTDVLGADYRQSVNVWSHYVSASSNAAGWPPHADGYQEAGKLTIWIPLSDATLDNGCIYVIPKHRLSEQLAERIFETGQLSTADLGILLHNTRALPASAGTILAWDYDVMHWGSICDQPAHPRISIAVNFMSATVAAERIGKPSIVGSSGIPTFLQRLYIVANSLRIYVGREPLISRYLPLSELLAEITKSSFFSSLT